MVMTKAVAKNKLFASLIAVRQLAFLIKNC